MNILKMHEIVKLLIPIFGEDAQITVFSEGKIQIVMPESQKELRSANGE